MNAISYLSSLFTTTIWFTAYTGISLLRTIIAYAVFAAIALDDIRGPTVAAKSTTQTSIKWGKDILNGSVINANSAWIFSIIFEIIFISISATATRLLVAIVGITVGAVYQHFILNEVWKGRGNVLAWAQLKPGMHMCVGDGAMGARKFTLKIACILTAFTFVLEAQ